ADGVLVSANKSLIGHTMAAAGALEAIATILTLVHGLVPPTGHLAEPDPEIPFDCVPNVARPARLSWAMSNSFGFGGQNVSLLFRRSPAGGGPDGGCGRAASGGDGGRHGERARPRRRGHARGGAGPGRARPRANPGIHQRGLAEPPGRRGRRSPP